MWQQKTSWDHQEKQRFLATKIQASKTQIVLRKKIHIQILFHSACFFTIPFLNGNTQTLFPIFLFREGIYAIHNKGAILRILMRAFDSHLSYLKQQTYLTTQQYWTQHQAPQAGHFHQWLYQGLELQEDPKTYTSLLFY